MALLFGESREAFHDRATTVVDLFGLACSACVVHTACARYFGFVNARGEVFHTPSGVFPIGAWLCVT